ncbi:MAG: hypothetical protein E7342_03065 [Clostridiales bacterium]|nr:hypothetical protein [Clostridiales bacterium]
MLGTILFLVSYTIYLLCTVGLKFWIIYLIFLSVLILLIAIVTLRIVFFEEFEVVNTVYTITNLKTYILGTLKKYSSLPIILISIFAIIAFYYVLKHNLFENYLSLKEVNKPIYYASFIMVAIFTLYASIDCSRKKICFLDLLFIALALATPAIWCQLIIFGALTHNLIVCIVLTVFVVFFMAIRVLNTDLLFEEKSKTTHKIGNVSYGLKAYYKEIFSKFSFMSALTLASTIIFLILCAYRFGILDISNPYYSIYIYYAVSGILLFATVIAFICTIFTLITCKSYKVLFTDYVLFVLFLISLICLVLALVSNLSYFVLASAICSAYCLTLSNTRIRHVKIYDGVEK